MLKIIPKEQYNKVGELFNSNDVGLPLIFSIIEKFRSGEIWVDDENNPKFCLIISSSPYCFIKGDINDEIFRECNKILYHKKKIKLVLLSNNEFDLSRFGFMCITKREYRFKKIDGITATSDNHTNYVLKKIKDIESFNVCIWKSLMLEIFNSVENYFSHGIGFMLWDDVNQIVVSEVHGIKTKKFIEALAVTKESHRNQKLSTIICSHLLKYALDNKLTLICSCNEDNYASWHVAEKQGSAEMVTYNVYEKNKS